MLGLHNAWAGFRDVGSLLIKRGTVMGPLIPLLFLALVFVLAAYLFRETAVVHGVPIFSAVFVLAALVIIFSYLRHYTDFAKRDPDRLQSEEYRLLTMQQMIAAKELRHPMPVETLPLTEPTENPAEPQARTESQARTEGERTPDSTVAEEEREP